jgi:hypothetical protein
MSEFKSWDEMSKLEQMACEYSDYYKSAYGFRPRHVDTSTWTVEDFEAVFDELAGVCERNQLHEAELEAEAAHGLELRIQSLLSHGAKDRAMAIRWIDEAEGADGDREYLCFLLGVRYGYFNDETTEVSKSA